MKKNLNILTLFFRLLCGLILTLYVFCFLFGDKIALRFSDPELVPVFTHILVFTATASVYGLFISAIRSSQKIRIKLLLFIGGMLIGSLPLLIYHGYLQYRCGFWNQQQTTAKIMYINPDNEEESIKLIRSECEISKEEKTDTIYVKKLGNFFEWQHNADIQKSTTGKWISP